MLPCEGSAAQLNRHRGNRSRALPAAALQTKLVASIQQLRTNANEARLRIEEHFRTENQGLLARKSEYEAEVSAIEAEIRGNTERIEVESRKARELVRRIAVLEEELGREKGELDGITKAIAETTARGAALVERNNQDTHEQQALLDATQVELASRLRSLNEQAQQLIKGKFGASAALPVAELTATVSGRAAEAIAREESALLDEANLLTFQYANWLYLFSRQPRALEWAVSVQTRSELNIVLDRLDKINKDVQSTIGLSTPRFFTVRLSRDDLRLATQKPDEDGSTRLVFSIAPMLSGLSQGPLQIVDVREPTQLGEEPYSVYGPLSAFRGRLVEGGSPSRWDQQSSELIFAPFVETERGALSLLWDVWVIPKWRGTPPAELRMIGLRPLGPTEYFVGGVIDAQPVLRPRQPNYSSTAFTYSRIRARYRAAMQRVFSGDAEKTLIDGTLPGMNYRSVLGRGIGNTWELVLPRTWSRGINAAPLLEDLDGVDVVFGYLVSPERNDGLAPTGLGQDLLRTEPDPSQSSLIVKQECLSPLDKLVCAADAYTRNSRREDELRPGGVRRSVASDAKLEGLYSFRNGPAGRTGRERLLDLWDAILPTTAQLARGLDASDLPQVKFLDCFATDPLPVESIGACPNKSLARTLLNNFPSKDIEGEDLGLRIAKTTHKMVRDEMLALPKEPSPVGPLELLLTWRSVEALVGRVDVIQSGAASETSRPTLLAEIETLELRLEHLTKLLDGVAQAIEGPTAVARRLVDDYETSRMQIQFARDLADALRNSPLLHDAEASGKEKGDEKLLEAVSELRRLTRGWKSYECPERWLSGALASQDPRIQGRADRAIKGIQYQQYGVLQRAYEPDFGQLGADKDHADEPLRLESFPIVQCSGGPFTNASKQDQAAARAQQ
jgi:hypothetical protein